VGININKVLLEQFNKVSTSMLKRKHPTKIRSSEVFFKQRICPYTEHMSL